MASILKVFQQNIKRFVESAARRATDLCCFFLAKTSKKKDKIAVSFSVCLQSSIQSCSKFGTDLEWSITSLFETWNPPFRVCSKLGMLHSELVTNLECSIPSIQRFSKNIARFSVYEDIMKKSNSKLSLKKKVIVTKSA